VAEEIESNTDETSDEEILRVARDRFKICQEAYVDIHKEGRIDDNFSVGDQWPEDVRMQRESEGRPCLTVNRVSQAIRQVANDQKQNNPTATFSPEDDDADIETADIYQGINRNIEKSSNADGARDWAFDGAARRGFGYWRIITDWVSPTSFLQEVKYQKIFDAYSVYLDPNHTEVDGSDSNYGFIFTRMQKDEFLAKYPDADLSKENEWASTCETLPDCFDEYYCLVAEYYYKDFKREKLILLSNGESYTESKLEELKGLGLIPADAIVERERETVTEQVKWIKFAGEQIMERTDWGSQWIPIIPVYGEVHLVDGKKVLKGVTRDSRDPQRMHNYFVSAEAEAIGLAPKAPFVGAAGQFEGFESIWATANSKPHSFLQYNAVDVNGNLVPAPQRVQAEAQVQAITSARIQSQEDIKATNGIYDAALGNRSNENSGIAIERRANQAQTSNYHIMANFEQSAKHSGRIVAQLIPVTYDTPRAAKIVGEDGESEIIRINEEFQRDGQPKTYDLSKGKYDLSINMGPAYATKRQEALSSMLEITKMNPQLMAVIGDLIVKHMDWPGAQEIVERIRKTMDPKLLDENVAQIPPQVQAQMMQMGQLIQQLQLANSEIQQKLDAKVLDIQSKERMKAAELETDLIKEQMKMPTELAMVQFQEQLAQLQQWQDQVTQLFNGAGHISAAPPIQEQQQPTGGMPGSYME
jgi:hypothetical protein